VLDDVEHELVLEKADETEATNPNQRVVNKINPLVLDDVEHELVVEEADETEATKSNQPTCAYPPNLLVLIIM
jgi:hypothetical protein